VRRGPAVPFWNWLGTWNNEGDAVWAGWHWERSSRSRAIGWVRLSKIAYYLADNVVPIRLSNLRRAVKNKRGGSRVSRPVIP